MAWSCHVLRWARANGPPVTFQCTSLRSADGRAPIAAEAQPQIVSKLSMSATIFRQACVRGLRRLAMCSGSCGIKMSGSQDHFAVLLAVFEVHYAHVRAHFSVLTLQCFVYCQNCCYPMLGHTFHCSLCSAWLLAKAAATCNINLACGSNKAQNKIYIHVCMHVWISHMHIYNIYTHKYAYYIYTCLYI